MRADLSDLGSGQIEHSPTLQTPSSSTAIIATTGSNHLRRDTPEDYSFIDSPVRHNTRSRSHSNGVWLHAASFNYYSHRRLQSSHVFNVEVPQVLIHSPTRCYTHHRFQSSHVFNIKSLFIHRLAGRRRQTQYPPRPEVDRSNSPELRVRRVVHYRLDSGDSGGFTQHPSTISMLTTSSSSCAIPDCTKSLASSKLFLMFWFKTSLLRRLIRLGRRAQPPPIPITYRQSTYGIPHTCQVGAFNIKPSPEANCLQFIYPTPPSLQHIEGKFTSGSTVFNLKFNIGSSHLKTRDSRQRRVHVLFKPLYHSPASNLERLHNADTYMLTIRLGPASVAILELGDTNAEIIHYESIVFATSDQILRKKMLETYQLPQRLSRMVILELGDVRGIAFAPEGVADALVMRVRRGRGDEVEGAAHDVLVEEFMARYEAAVVGLRGGREPVDVGSEESSPFGHGEGGECNGDGRRHSGKSSVKMSALYTRQGVNVSPSFGLCGDGAMPLLSYPRGWRKPPE
ncbi:hypothetical protein C8R44DRAFT_748034 [Mycena epipterygia]|nr:hypothetical protein C8R44DRAFT_748034 [Mycena epipterygia]